MLRVSQKEFEELMASNNHLYIRSKNHNPVTARIRRLDVFEALFVEASEWTLPTTISMVLAQEKRRTGKEYTSCKAKDHTGYVILRVK